MFRTAVAVVAALLAAGCSQERERTGREACAPSFRPEVQAALAESCTSCHGGAQPAGDYDLTTYNAALGGGTDEVANAIAGDAQSRILTVLDPATADDVHRPLSDLLPLLTDWVVSCRLSYFDSLIHDHGLLDPAADGFHGKFLVASGYDFAQCAKCHGDDFRGGKAGVSCLTCHRDGPTGCTTCHGEGPTSGAHPAHLVAGALDKPVDCAECHVVPARYDDEGHIFRGGAVDPPPAEVSLGELAARTPPGYERAGPPAYDPATGACANVYCHGGVFADSSATHPAPVWTAVGEGQAACGGCHGLGPSSHVDDRCAGCHPTVVDADRTIVSTALHLDGVVEVGRGRGDCGDCHGGGPDGAPPPDLSGGVNTGLLTVGAHAVHVRASRLRGPIPCSDCHLQPAAVDSPGHLDSGAPAEVFPGAGDFGGLAAAGGASPAFDREDGTCRNVYCHGGGNTRLADDDAGGLIRTPGWTALGRTQAACGRCHGIPPIDGFHAPDLTIRDCHTCHGSSVDEDGNIIVSGPPGAETSTHIDANVP